jgi:hypothetical protein
MLYAQGREAFEKYRGAPARIQYPDYRELHGAYLADGDYLDHVTFSFA